MGRDVQTRQEQQRHVWQKAWVRNQGNTFGLQMEATWEMRSRLAHQKRRPAVQTKDERSLEGCEIENDHSERPQGRYSERD